MRVILVGGPADRDRLREQMNGSMTVVAEFPTIAAARRSDLDVDAMLIAPDTVHAEALDNDDSLDEPLTARELQVPELLAERVPNRTSAARLSRPGFPFPPTPRARPTKRRADSRARARAGSARSVRRCRRSCGGCGRRE